MNLKINKCPDTKKYLGLKYILKDWGYLSWWIANLGVVPLLLFAAFLFLPAFVFLRALLFFVTLVFDTISFLHIRKLLCELRRIKYLPRLYSSVKTLAAIVLVSFSTFSSAGPKLLETQSFTLSIGEIKEVFLPQIDRFTVASNDSVSHKFIKKTKTLLIKAKKLGLSEVHIWNKTGARSKIKIFVLSRISHLKLQKLSENFHRLGLEVVNEGTKLNIRGELTKVSLYKEFLGLQKNEPEKLIVNVSLSKELKNALLGEVIKSLFDDHIIDFKCEIQSITLYCHLSDKREPSPEIEKFLKNRLGVYFIRHYSRHSNSNFKLKIKIIQIESLDSRAHGFGLNQLSGNLTDFFDQGWQSLYAKNQILLKDLGIEASLLAEPSLLIRPDRKIKIQIGSEIPYSAKSSDGTVNTSFKFAGLKLNVLLKKEGDGYLIDYSSEITKPGSAGEISGSKESASARISLSMPTQLFEINFQTDAINKESLPAVGRVPFFGSLFSNTNANKSFKKITGIILLEEI